MNRMQLNGLEQKLLTTKMDKDQFQQVNQVIVKIPHFDNLWGL